jgi:hypothetical protein
MISVMIQLLSQLKKEIDSSTFGEMLRFCSLLKPSELAERNGMNKIIIIINTNSKVAYRRISIRKVGFDSSAPDPAARFAVQAPMGQYP